MAEGQDLAVLRVHEDGDRSIHDRPPELLLTAPQRLLGGAAGAMGQSGGEDQQWPTRRRRAPARAGAGGHSRAKRQHHQGGTNTPDSEADRTRDHLSAFSGTNISRL